MLRGLFLCLVGIPALVCAQEAEPVRKPYLEVGDCWSYEAKNLSNKGQVDSFQECITHIDTRKDLVITLAIAEPGERELAASYSTEWAERRFLDAVQKDPAQRLLRFPLRIGDSHNLDYSIDYSSRGPGRAGREQIRVRNVGWEDVTVPAGSFRAMKIEAIGTWRIDETRSTCAYTLWYSPQVQRWVRRISANGRGPITDVQLTKYKLSP